MNFPGVYVAEYVFSLPRLVVNSDEKYLRMRAALPISKIWLMKYDPPFTQNDAIRDTGPWQSNNPASCARRDVWNPDNHRINELPAELTRSILCRSRISAIKGMFPSKKMHFSNESLWFEGKTHPLLFENRFGPIHGEKVCVCVCQTLYLREINILL